MSGEGERKGRERLNEKEMLVFGRLVLNKTHNSKCHFDNRNLKKMKTSLQKVRIYGRYA